MILSVKLSVPSYLKVSAKLHIQILRMNLNELSLAAIFKC